MELNQLTVSHSSLHTNQDRKRARLGKRNLKRSSKCKSNKPRISKPEGDIVSNSLDIVSYVSNLVQITSTRLENFSGVGLVYGNLLVTVPSLVCCPDPFEKFFLRSDGGLVEIACKTRSIWMRLSVLRIKKVQNNLPELQLPLLKPHAVLDHQFAEGEEVQMLVFEDNEPRVETGKIHLGVTGKTIILPNSNRVFPLGTPVFNSEKHWIGLIRYSSEYGDTSVTNLPKDEMKRNCPPRRVISNLGWVRDHQEIAEEIAKFPSKWIEIAKAYKLPDQIIKEFESIENEVERVKDLLWQLNWSPVPMFKKILTQVGLESVAESEYLKDELVWQFD